MPELIGKYRVVARLASGGMGEVFLARHEGPAGFSKTVVIKRVLPHLAHDREFIARFLDEARLAALLSHPNVVQVFELGEDAGTWYLAMEHVHGVSLRALLGALARGSRGLSPWTAAAVVASAARGLHHAHTLKVDGVPKLIVHRDVSPENVLVGFAGEVKVVDFGIAKAADSAATTRPGVVRGKVGYLAPELITGELATPASDVYAAGAMLYELLAREPLFPGLSDSEVMHRLHARELPRLAQRCPELPPGFAAAADRALSPAPEGRFRSAAELADALESLARTAPEGEGLAALPGLLAERFPAEAAGSPTPSRVTIDHRPAVEPVTDPVPMGAPVRTLSTEIATLDLNREQASRPVGIIAAAVALAVVAVAATALALRPAPVPLSPERAPQDSPVATASSTDAGATVELAIDDVTLARNKPQRRPTGRVKVFTKPWARVYLGDKLLGVTPLVDAVEVPAGPQTFTFKNDELKVSKVHRVQVSPNTTTEVKVNLLE